MNDTTLINPSWLKKSAILWLLVVLCLLFSLFYLLPKSRLNSSVLSLLPQEQVSAVPQDIVSGFQERLDKQLVWLIKPESPTDDKAVKWLYQHLQEQDFIQSINGYFDLDFQRQWGDFAFSYRYQLVDENIIEQLRSKDYFNWMLSQIYSPFSGVNAQELLHDPLLLTRASQLNQLQQAGRASITNNWLTYQDKKGDLWYMIYAELNDSSLNMNQSEQIVQQLDALVTELHIKWPNTEILKRGVLFYSNYASHLAKQDISTIGSLSIVGIILLIIIIFRSIRPIILTLLSVTVGMLCGFVAVLTIFGEIHIITLVMSTSVIGISIDYSIHYLTERLLHGKQESPYKSLAKLLSTLTVALGTSLIAYFILLITPFPGLKQLASFTIFGLIGAFLSVICWYPYLVSRLPVRENIAQRLISFWLKLWQTLRMQVTMIILALVFIGYGMSQLTIDDDIGRLQALPAALQQDELKIIDITQQSTDQKWFIIYGQNSEQTLQRLDAFLPQLTTLQHDNVLSDYQSINLSSIKKQTQVIDFIEEISDEIFVSLTQIGIQFIPPDFSQIKQKLVTPELWEQSVVSQGRKLLWLTLPNGQSATLVPISGIRDASRLVSLSSTENGIYWLDRRGEFNSMFTNYRIQLSKLLAVAVTAICGCFIYRNRHKGFKAGLKSALPTLLSIGCALSMLGLTHQPLNLFAMLALILVIGVGIDYSLFLSNDKNHVNSALLAVLMAALTTLLSFGLLVLSHTEAIVGFALVLVGGIFAALLFAPLVIKSPS